MAFDHNSLIAADSTRDWQFAIARNYERSWGWHMRIWNNNPTDERRRSLNPSQAEEDDLREADNTPDPDF